MAQKKERSEYLETHLNITECSQRKPYVFVSYASDNWEAVFKSAVVPLQKQHGLRVYADKAFDTVNDKWIVPMLRNVRGSDMMVAFVSQSYIESYACFLELLTAVNSKKQIVFVSLGEQLHLGDTTDQPEIERGVKNEILNQGSNLATNTNNTSNDIMRAMKSAYTSLSTLLEQDALSKYDISDAFINFFRDASINQKTIHDLGAVAGTIGSISGSVFDLSLTSGVIDAAEPSGPADEPAAESEMPLRAEPVQHVPAEPGNVYRPAESREPRREETSPPRQGNPIARLARRMRDGWKNDSPALASVGIWAGILGFVPIFVLPAGPNVVAWLACSVFGIVCGIKSLRSGKRAMPILALIVSGLIPLIFLLSIV